MHSPPENWTGPLVFGKDWLLEMLRAGTATYGLFWAPFAIVHDIPLPNGTLQGEFIGFSFPAKPPAAWLTTSMVFDMGSVPLARTAGELISLVQQPRPYRPMEAIRVSELSQRAKDRIASTYSANIPVSAIARELDVSHSHLTRQFKRDFGLTPVSYRYRLRVSDAIGRLSQGQSILDTAYETGFNDLKRFYEDFRKVTGSSPGKCR